MIANTIIQYMSTEVCTCCSVGWYLSIANGGKTNFNCRQACSNDHLFKETTANDYHAQYFHYILPVQY